MNTELSKKDRRVKSMRTTALIGFAVCVVWGCKSGQGAGSWPEISSNGMAIKVAPGWKTLDSDAAAAKGQSGEVILRLVNSVGGSIIVRASKVAPGVTAQSLADNVVAAAKTTNAVSVDQAPQKSAAKLRAGDATVVRWVSTSRKNRQSTATSDYLVENSGYVWQVTTLAAKDNTLQIEEDEMVKSFGVVGTPH